MSAGQKEVRPIRLVPPSNLWVDSSQCPPLPVIGGGRQGTEVLQLCPPYVDPTEGGAEDVQQVPLTN